MRFCLTLLLSIALATALPMQVAAQDDPPSQADLDALNEAIDRARSRLDDTNNERSRAQKEIQETEQDISALQADISDIEQQMALEQQRLSELREERRHLEQEKLAQQDTIALYLRSAWQSGREEYLKLLLNQESIGDTSRMVRYYQYFSQARAEAILAYNRTLNRLTETEQEVQASNLSLAESQRELAGRLQSLEENQRNRQDRLQELEQILENSGQELARLEQEREEVEILLEELNRSSARRSLDIEPFAGLRGQLPWPVEGPLLNSFGSRQNRGDLTWQGVSIDVSPGTDVHAIHHGQVVYSDWFGSFGLLLIIDHGDGYMSLYARNQQLNHDVGDWVNGGDIIATSGNTGGHRQASLYFEIRHDGRSRDPVAWCEAR